jgi:hypothetical protein
MATVVVGVDSSDGAKRALAFALEEARLRGATLWAVHVWSFPAIAGPGGGRCALSACTGELRGALESLAITA